MEDKENIQKKTFPWLYKRDSTGGIRCWRIFVESNAFYTESGVVGGKMTVSKPNYTYGKNTEKANATTDVEQAEKEAQAKWDKKAKTGYFLKVEDIDAAFKSPMLCKNFKDYSDTIDYPVGVEEKLNGVRAVWDGQKLVSRKNETFHTVPHILDEIHKLPVKDHSKLFLDGEFFNYKEWENLNRLTKCVSVVIKEPSEEQLQASRELVQYHLYDGYGFYALDGTEISQSTPFKERRAALRALIDTCNKTHKLQFVFNIEPYTLCSDAAAVVCVANKIIAKGSEGAIIRNLSAAYEHKRSKNLLKFKQFFDREFLILAVDEGRGNWAGCVKRIQCEIPEDMRVPGNDMTFWANVEGSMEYLRHMLQHADEVIGKLATVRYQCVSEYGVPQIPYVESIRDYE